MRARLALMTRHGLHFPVRFLVLLVAGAAMGAPGARPSEPAVQFSTDAASASVSFLSWDSEGGGRETRNLLRAPLELRVCQTNQATRLTGRRKSPSARQTELVFTREGGEITWTLRRARRGLIMAFRASGPEAKQLGAMELAFPFDPRVTPTTVLPARWETNGEFHLPAIISAPDFGQMLLSTLEPVAEVGGPGHSHGSSGVQSGRQIKPAAKERTMVKGRLLGSRAKKEVDLILALPRLAEGQRLVLSLTPVRLPPPRGLKDRSLWPAARRGWFGALQSSAQWGDAGHPFSAPAGMLANNVISDPASCSLWFYADQAFFTPELAPGISAMSLVRRTLDWWLDEKVLPDGEMICYWDKAHFLDANAGPLIAAWDYVDATGDLPWLRRRIARLEFIADYLARRDVDGDGLVEAWQSGNAGTLREPMRSCAWWDALNCGHKDAYSNALIYRAWRSLADLEARLGREEGKLRFTQQADRLKAAYARTFFNPETGWLMWWKSEDGAAHDYASPVVNGLAIEYGLVDQARGRAILARLRHKAAEVGFNRFDLGVPPMLVPVRRADYLLPNACGVPQRDDGTDTFGYYMNGGITAGQVLHFLAAHYVVGEGAEADRILRAMLGRQAEGGFQNGAVNAYPHGIDWTTWDGKPAGYEGYLADSFRFLQAVLLRERSFRARLYRPLER